MSVITGIVLVVSVAEGKNLTDLVDWFKKNPLNEDGVELNDVLSKQYKSTWLGWHPQFEIFGCGYNYMPFELKQELIDRVKHIDWDFPENVVLTLQPEEGNSTVITLSATVNPVCTCLSSSEDDAYDPGGPMSGKPRPPRCPIHLNQDGRLKRVELNCKTQVGPIKD